MGFHNGCYAKVWEVKVGKGNYAEVRISISEKDKRTNDYETTYSGFVRFVGDAYKSLPEEGDRIKMDSVDMTNFYDKEKKVTYWNAKCFSWSPADSGQNNSEQKPAAKRGFMEIPEDAAEELPFN